MIRQNKGGAALSVLMMSTIVAGIVTALCGINAITMTIDAEQADGNQAYYLARTDAIEVLRDLNQGRHDASTKIIAPDGYISRRIDYGASLISATCTAHTGRAIHEVGFTYRPSTHEVTRWQDAMEPGASNQIES